MTGDMTDRRLVPTCGGSNSSLSNVQANSKEM